MRIDLHHMSALSGCLACCPIVFRTCSVLLILIHLYLVLSSPTNSDGRTIVPAAKLKRDLNATSVGDNAQNYCTDNTNWTANTRAPWDCTSAMTAFEKSYFMRQFGKQPVEFIAPGAKAEEPYHYFTIPTPLKFRTSKQQTFIPNSSYR